jgi:hypothetical protein
MVNVVTCQLRYIVTVKYDRVATVTVCSSVGMNSDMYGHRDLQWLLYIVQQKKTGGVCPIEFDSSQKLQIVIYEYMSMSLTCSLFVLMRCMYYCLHCVYQNILTSCTGNKKE